MFRHNASRGAGPGRGPGLSHSCWVYQRGIVPRQEKPAAGGWAPGSWTTGSGFLTNCSLKVPANSAFLLLGPSL